MTVEELLQNIKRKLDLDEIRLDTEVHIRTDEVPNLRTYEVQSCDIADNLFGSRVLLLTEND